MNKKGRISSIDYLRAISIIAIVLIHTNAYFLKWHVAAFLWNFSQYAVAAFIFCSAYVFFVKDPISSFYHYGSYIKKRFVRLLIPYYYFLIPFLFIQWLYGHFHLSLSFVLRYVTLTNKGTQIDWLALLFIELSFIMPFIAFLWKKRVLFGIYAFLSFSASLYFLFYSTPIHYRFIMWLPWSLVVVIAFLLIQTKKRNLFLIATTIVFGTIWIASAFYLSQHGHSLDHYRNKYPPNIYHLSYGIFFTSVLFFILENFTNLLNPVSKLLVYISSRSYPLFFIHFFIIFFMDMFFNTFLQHLSWWQFYLIVLFLSLITQKTIDLALFYIKQRTNNLNVSRSS